jgi:hypothetical protein
MKFKIGDIVNFTAGRPITLKGIVIRTEVRDAGNNIRPEWIIVNYGNGPEITHTNNLEKANALTFFIKHAAKSFFRR